MSDFNCFVNKSISTNASKSFHPQNNICFTNFNPRRQHERAVWYIPYPSSTRYSGNGAVSYLFDLTRHIYSVFSSVYLNGK